MWLIKGKILLFWGGVIFTLAAPLFIGIFYKDTNTTWVAALCGAFVTFMARIDDITEISLGPVKAKMRETIKEAYVTIEELRNVAAISAKAILTDIMAGTFVGGMNLKTRLSLHDQIITSLKEIKASENAIKDAEEMWLKGIRIIYLNIIKASLEGRDKLSKSDIKTSPENLEASRELNKMLCFEKWQTPSPDEIESFIEGKVIMTEKLSEWISDYRHFMGTGLIRRREDFENAF